MCQVTMSWMFIRHRLDAVLSTKEVICNLTLGLCRPEILFLSWLWITDGHVTSVFPGLEQCLAHSR